MIGRWSTILDTRVDKLRAYYAEFTLPDLYRALKDLELRRMENKAQRDIIDTKIKLVEEAIHGIEDKD